METTRYPTQMVTRDREPVNRLLSAAVRPVLGSFDPDNESEGLRCSRCGVNSTFANPVYDGYPFHCRNCRGAAEATVIKLQVPHVECACCGARLPNGRQHVIVQGGRVFHWSHQLCGFRCQSGAVVRQAAEVAV